jgi:integrase
MGCQIQQHGQGFQLVRPTAFTPSSARIFLVALKCFYKVMKRLGRYDYHNPLLDSSGELLASVEEYLEDDNQPPRMPDISGVQEPNSRDRLTDSYYKIVGDKWIPQIINDPHFPTQVFQGGHSLPQWNLRAEVVTRILFETGSRVSEAVGLTVGDWVERGMKQEANAFSKGSNGRRVKFIRFSADTAKLLRRYFNQERIKHDSNGYTLDNYFKLAKQNEISLKDIPLFLTNRQTALSADHYRDNYWKPACQAVGIKADVHQARHWYVTMAIKQIHEISTSEGEVERRKRELKEYMKWRSEETMKAYDHYFDSLRHTEIQDNLHARMDTDLTQQLEQLQNRQSAHQAIATFTKQDQSVQEALPQDEDLMYLLRIGRKSRG